MYLLPGRSDIFIIFFCYGYKLLVYKIQGFILYKNVERMDDEVRIGLPFKSIMAGLVAFSILKLAAD